MYDYIVVGSGATGSQAAQTLVEAGSRVAMLDVGFEDNFYKNLIPQTDFVSIRRSDPDQHVYFLGKDFEGIVWGKTRVGSQLTPPRKHMVQDVDKYLPVMSNSFTPMESLSYGGLGNGWGTGCHVFSRTELDAVGLEHRTIEEAYRVVARRIGISAAVDDATPYCLGFIEDFSPAVNLEKNQEGILRSYQRKRSKFNQRGIHLGRTALALLTRDLSDRKMTSYDDMEFWADHQKAAYRPRMTVDELKKKDNFTYHGQCLVLKFIEKEDSVDVMVRRVDTQQIEIFSCKKLVLASGVLGTARIVIRSFDRAGEKLPIISNPYCYIPCLQLRALGKPVEPRKVSLGQLVMFDDRNGNNFDVGMAALFSYRSLLLFKLIKEAPLNFSDARMIMQYLQSSFIIAGVHHPEKSSEDKFIQLIKNDQSITGDSLKAQYVLSDAEEQINRDREKKWYWALRQLGCYPIKTIYPGHGSSIHYAGTLPFSKEKKMLTLSPSGKLWGTDRVYVADGSGFKYLPAKGLTFTLMANAHVVALNTLREK